MPKQPEKIIGIRALIGKPGTSCAWQAITQAEMKRLEPGTSLAITRETPHGQATLYTCWRPPRRRDESPVQYYKRTKVVDDRFTDRHKGWYYCNPAHCKHRWRSKAERDKHMGIAYAALD